MAWETPQTKVTKNARSIPRPTRGSPTKNAGMRRRWSSWSGCRGWTARLRA